MSSNVNYSKENFKEYKIAIHNCLFLKNKN